MNTRLLFLVILLHLNLVLVRANYNLSITLNSYTNVNNLCVECRDDGVGCCDDFEARRCTTPNRGSRCETYFEYCLLPLNTIASSGPVPCTVRARSNPATDDSAINFAQSTVLGLSNPLVLREPSSAWNGIQLQITAVDDDPSGSDDLIDFFQLNINSGDTSGSSNLNGFHRIAQISLSYLVDLNNCIGIDCSGRGQCIDGQNSYTCVCNSGFTGTNCEININDCAGVTCSGRGTCVDGVNSFICSCNLGFTGASCETNINDCAGVTCSKRGTCVDGVNSFTCSCDLGFTGAQCQTNIDDCVGIDCSGSGQCMDGVNSYICMCDAGFTGANCDITIVNCNGVTCSGNGQCVEGMNSYTCSCNNGFTGDNCQFEVQQGGCSGMNCTDLIVNNGSEYIALIFIIGGALGGFIIILVMFAVILAAILFCHASRTKQATESPRPRHSAAQRHHHDSYDLTENINYNGPSNFTGEEAIYDEIATGAAGTGVGCRRHGVYAFNNEEMNEMEPYNSVYDVVL